MSLNLQFYFPLLLTFLLFIFTTVVKLWKRSKARVQNPKVPPGPWMLPLIGNLFQLFGSLAQHALRDLAKKYGPIMELRLVDNVESMDMNCPLRPKSSSICGQWVEILTTDYRIDADCFQPERLLGSSITYMGTNFDYLLSGAGRRICPGISYGTAVIELAFAQLLYHFDWKLPNGLKPEELDMTETFEITARREDDLYLIAIPG